MAIFEAEMAHKQALENLEEGEEEPVLELPPEEELKLDEEQ